MPDRLSGDPPLWLRGPARVIEYEERGPQISLDLDQVEEYPLDWAPGLLYKVAAVRHPNDALAIVRDHGLLKLGPPLPSTHAEPFRWWTELAQELNRILRAYRLVQAAGRGSARAFQDLRDFASKDASVREESRERHGSADPPGEDLLYSVSREVGRSVSEGLFGSAGHMFVVPTPEDPARLVFAPGGETLEAVVWHELAQEITTNVPLRDCAECYAVFRVYDQRQRYCSERCATRARGRRFRQKKKED